MSLSLCELRWMACSDTALLQLSFGDDKRLSRGVGKSDRPLSSNSKSPQGGKRDYRRITAARVVA